MDRHTINRICAGAPLVMSALAIGLLASVLVFHWETPPPGGDEGMAAHLFQLLIGGQALLIVAYLATADLTRRTRVAGQVALQIAAIAVAFAPVAYFHL
jgi:hypothetical protein